VLLDYLLIFGYGGFPRLEIAGAAVAAVVAASVGSCLYVWLFLRRALQQGFLGQALVPFDRQECRGLLRLSGPVGCQGALETGTWLLFATLVGRLGSAEMAAHHIATNVLTLSYMASYGVAVAATTLVGQYLGAGDHAAARRSVRSCLVLVSVLTGVMGVSFLLWRCELVWVFNHDPAVVRLSVQLLVCIALFQGFDGLALVAAGVLRGAGDTRWPMLASLVFGWGVFIPLAYLSIFPLRGGVVGGWRAAMLHILLLSVTMTARLARGQWQQSRPPQAGPP
jgi:putative MATE family efflux protein